MNHRVPMNVFVFASFASQVDIIGRLVEVVSGMDLEAFLQERILGPLKMVDTSFCVVPEKRERYGGTEVRGERQTYGKRQTVLVY